MLQHAEYHGDPEGDVEVLLDVLWPVHHAPGVRQDGASQPLRVLEGVGSGQVATETVTWQKIRNIELRKRLYILLLITMVFGWFRHISQWKKL